jgi:preprotein translocase subunit SecG
MEPLIIAVHILISVGIIALILLQQGKGAEMGASFGSGGSQTLFGSTGSGNLLSHVTAALVAIFFITSFGLSVLAKNKSVVGSDAGLPSTEIIQAHNATVSEKVAKPDPAAPAPVTDVPALGNVAPAGDVPAVPEKK